MYKTANLGYAYYNTSELVMYVAANQVYVIIILVMFHLNSKITSVSAWSFICETVIYVSNTSVFTNTSSKDSQQLTVVLE